jgi:hypothetical protein
MLEKIKRQLDRLEEAMGAHEKPAPVIIIEFVKPPDPCKYDQPDEPLDEPNKAGEDER